MKGEDQDLQDWRMNRMVFYRMCNPENPNILSILIQTKEII